MMRLRWPVLARSENSLVRVPIVGVYARELRFVPLSWLLRFVLNLTSFKRAVAGIEDCWLAVMGRFLNVSWASTYGSRKFSLLLVSTENMELLMVGLPPRPVVLARAVATRVEEHVARGERTARISPRAVLFWVFTNRAVDRQSVLMLRSSTLSTSLALTSESLRRVKFAKLMLNLTVEVRRECGV